MPKFICPHCKKIIKKKYLSHQDSKTRLNVLKYNKKTIEILYAKGLTLRKIHEFLYKKEIYCSTYETFIKDIRSIIKIKQKPSASERRQILVENRDIILGLYDMGMSLDNIFFHIKEKGLYPASSVSFKTDFYKVFFPEKQKESNVDTKTRKGGEK